MKEKTNDAFFPIFILIILVSVFITYYKYVILQDFSFLVDEHAFNESLLVE